MARSASALLAAALALALPALGQAACPGLIMVSGDPIAEPIVIHDYEEACKLYGAFFGSPAADATTRVATRPSLRIGLFWTYVPQDRLAELKPDGANQFGRFYPAVAEEPALVDIPGFGQWPKVVNETALRILEAHEVTTRVDDTTARGVPWVAVGAIAALLAVPLVLLARSRRYRRSQLPRLAE